MISFEVTKKSKRSRARLGELVTPHGVVATPAMVTVATQATVKAATLDQVRAAGTSLMICNTFHLHLKPGEKIVKAAGGLHEFSGWRGPLMTDSGGFQVFSLGFGADLNMGKILSDAAYRRGVKVQHRQQPSKLSIGEHGVHFRSPLDGRALFLGPAESIKIQQSLGADIMFAFDECPPPVATKAYVAASLARTHRWAGESLAARTSRQALYGIVQGGKYRDLRVQSARFISGLPFDGFGIGGELGADKSVMFKMMGWVNDVLPSDRPRHLLGNGHAEDIRRIVAAGVDTFDCIVPTQYARHGVAFTSSGRLDVGKSIWLKDKRPLDRKCDCPVCAEYSRGFICHLFRAKEITAMILTTIHNLTYFNRLVAECRADIRAGRL